VLTQRCFDFAQLDSEPANLYLAVKTPNEMDSAVMVIPRKVAGPVQPRSRLI
jgi:hypothetical protein